MHSARRQSWLLATPLETRVKLLDLAEKGKIASLELSRGGALGVFLQVVEGLTEVASTGLDFSCFEQLSSLFEQLAGLLEAFHQHFPAEQRLALSLAGLLGLRDICDRCRWGWGNGHWLMNLDLALVATTRQEQKAREY